MLGVPVSSIGFGGKLLFLTESGPVGWATFFRADIAISVEGTLRAEDGIWWVGGADSRFGIQAALLQFAFTIPLLPVEFAVHASIMIGGRDDCYDKDSNGVPKAEKITLDRNNLGIGTAPGGLNRFDQS